jgi:hypothetical protein
MGRHTGKWFKDDRDGKIYIALENLRGSNCYTVIVNSGELNYHSDVSAKYLDTLRDITYEMMLKREIEEVFNGE